MKRICLASLILLWTLCTSGPMPLVGQESTTVETLRPGGQPRSVSYTTAIANIESAIRYELAAKDIPAFSVAIVDQSQLIWSAGFGFQDAEQETPATANTIYRVGSVSKLFTDIAVMQLAEDGALSIDTPIQKLLPEFQPHNPFGQEITLKSLMSHLSGLVRESPVGNYFDPSEPSLSQTVESLNGTQLVYPPHSRVKYSNAAVSVVGRALESLIEDSHPEYVRRKILDPLHMTESGFEVTPEMRLDLATGWMRTYDQRRFEAPEFLLGTGPAGNLYSSVNDLGKFLTWLLKVSQGQQAGILNPATLQKMTAPQRDQSGKELGFGLGFHVQSLDGYVKIGHGGAIYGFSTQAEALPERQLGVAAAASLDGSNGVVRRLVDFALRSLIAVQDAQELPEYLRTEPIAASRATELVGRYRSDDSKINAEIFGWNDQLLLRYGDFLHELRAAEDDGSIVIDDLVSFGTQVEIRGADVLLIGERSLRRVPSEPPPAVPERWRGLIGEYGWDHNTLYILEQDGHLYALIEWLYYYPLEELGLNEFAFPDRGLYHGERLFFTRDEEGYASRVVAAEVAFERRAVGTRDGETFRIQPLKPIEELRRTAMQAQPPLESGDFRDSDLVDLAELDASIKFDIRYAGTNNFMGARFYTQPRAFMQRPAAEALLRVQRQLAQRGLGLLIHDAYRPWHVTKMFWDATPADLKDFVANPANGSRHNRGCAVDLSLYDLESGAPIQMVSGYDEFSPRAYPLYPGGSSRQRWYRDLLRGSMQAAGFSVYQYEWWHFDFQDWQQYRIGNSSFEELVTAP